MTIKSFFYRSSSFIQNVSWDTNTEVLLVKFVSGTTWVYQDVPEEIYNRLVKSPSVGQYFNKNIRNKYISYVLNYPNKKDSHGQEKKAQKEV
jgi:hypothetical protein